MGFCLLNNIALGASVATDEFGLERVLIVDWDVHHGNGTQAMFWENARVGFFSMHRWPFYPGTGAADETGSGAGLGCTLNVPVEFGVARDQLMGQFRRQLGRFAERIRPQLVLVSAGFDAHREDPVGSLGMETEDFLELTQFLCQIADAYAGGSIVSVLEGGYNPAALTDCVDTHLHTLLD
jgi:acetoin utilization deacetylase AcuC-like enzyme